MSDIAAAARSATDKRSLIVVANRLPVSHSGKVWKPSSGGLVTALLPIMARSHGSWIGWDGGSTGVPRSIADTDVRLATVHLERSEVAGFYHGFSNRTVWPLFHDLIEPARFERSWWSDYVTVNERFAQSALKQVRKSAADPIVWIHDYHLMLVPRLLRDLRPTRSLFFLHIPFPPPELFARLPWREDILRGLLGADAVSFHTERYRKNFVRTCGRLLDDVRITGSRITTGDGRTVMTAAHPISIDAAEFSDMARSDAVQRGLAGLRGQFEGRTVLLGVDRLDYTKGILERLQAFEQLLDRRSDLRRELVLVQIAVPSRSSVREYRELRERVEQSVGRINGRFTEPGRDVPVHYIHRGVPRERLVAYYCLADVMLVTPLKDGMNLVAKEYVTSQAAVDGGGSLLLSEFTGAALELKQAISCNPFDIDGLSRAMESALEADEVERRRGIKAMAARVTKNDVHRWATDVLSGSTRGARSLPTEAYL